jgi:hypothetical protein
MNEDHHYKAPPHNPPVTTIFSKTISQVSRGPYHHGMSPPEFGSEEKGIRLRWIDAHV